jgi:hypothetical protein
MNQNELIPTENEVQTWLVSTLKHVCHIEYFLDKLNLGSKDSERPHDLVGPGNKYDWNVIKGFALAYRNPKPDFNKYILPSLEEHRKQYHHRMWNNPNPTNITKPIPEATREDMLVGAVDAICSLLENRQYQGGKHSFDDLTKQVENLFLPHKIPFIKELLPQMRSLKQPDLEQITSLHEFPNIGLNESVYDAIANRTNEVVETLRKEQKYLLK